MTMMVIVAHPDDEALYCGALIAKTAGGGEEVVTVTLTLGESGRTLGMCEADDLPDMRIAESRAAARVLGIAETAFFSLPDGKLGECQAEGSRLVRSVIDHWRPRTIVTFPPNGMNGHPDHRAVHRVARVALSGMSNTRLLLMTSREEFAEPKRQGYLPPEEVESLRMPATLTVNANGLLKRKLQALGCYESQARSILKRMRLYPGEILAESFYEAQP